MTCLSESPTQALCGAGVGVGVEWSLLDWGGSKLKCCWGAFVMSFTSTGAKQCFLFDSLARPLNYWQTRPPSVSVSHSHTYEHTYTHKHILSILNVWDNEFFSGLHVFSLLVLSDSCFYLFVTLLFLLLFLPLPLLSRCGWAGESCSSQTVHLPCSAKRPESSGRARAKGCSLRETASLHKPASVFVAHS